MRDTICRLCDIGQKSYYVWKNKSHSRLINLIERYFRADELEEWLDNDRIKKFEMIKNMSFEELRIKLNQSNVKELQVAQINRILYTTFKRRSLSYLYILIKDHNITDSVDLRNYNIKKDQENKFIAFFKELNHDSDANVVTFSFNRKEFNEFAELYLTTEEINFIFRNQKEFELSIKKILEHKLKKGV